MLLIRESEQELLLKQQQLVLSDQEKNIQRLRFLQSKAKLEKETAQKENELKHERLEANLQQEKAGQLLLHQQNKAKLGRNVSLFLSALVLVLIVAALLVYKAQRKTAKLNKLVLQQKEELEALGTVKDKLFSVVSHDMHTSVNLLMSFISLLENGNVSEEKLKLYAADLKNTLGYTSAMMENLLNWAYSQMQGFKPSIQLVDIGIVVTELINATEASRKDIAIFFNTSSNKLMVNTDKEMFTLIVRNLLNNAVKFTQKGGSVTYSCYKRARRK